MPIYEISSLPTPPDFPFSCPNKINDSGGICGFCQTSTVSFAIYWEKGRYEFLNLPGQPSLAFSINANNDIVGNYLDQSPNSSHPTFYGPFLPFVWNRDTGVTIILNGLSGQQDYGSANDINNSGEIVGIVIDRSAIAPDYIYWSGMWANSSGIPRKIGNLEGIGSRGVYGSGSSINENGLVAMDSFAGDGFSHASIWDPGIQTLKDIDGRYQYSSHASSINDLPSPQVVGSFQNAPNQSHAFFYDGVHPFMHDLGIPGEFSFASDLNNSGDVVGAAGGGAVLWHGTVRMNLNSSLISDAQAKGWDLGTATSINNNGQIIGYGTLNGDTNRLLPWLLTPHERIDFRNIPVEYMLPHIVWPEGIYEAPKPKGWPVGLPFPTPAPTPFQIVGSAYHKLNDILISKNILEMTRSMSDENERKEIQRIARNYLEREMPKLVGILNNHRKSF